MKIAFVVPYLWADFTKEKTPNIVKHYISLSNAMLERGHDVHMLMLGKDGAYTSDAGLKCRLICAENSMSFSQKVSDWLLHNRMDVVEGTSDLAPLLVPEAVSAAPIVVRAHPLQGYIVAHGMFLKAESLSLGNSLVDIEARSKLEDATIRYADVVSCPSKQVLEVVAGVNNRADIAPTSIPNFSYDLPEDFETVSVLVSPYMEDSWLDKLNIKLKMLGYRVKLIEHDMCMLETFDRITESFAVLTAEKFSLTHNFELTSMHARRPVICFGRNDLSGSPVFDLGSFCDESLGKLEEVFGFIKSNFDEVARKGIIFTNKYIEKEAAKIHEKIYEKAVAVRSGKI